jgi:EAL domain-containing protein (putative c-di-GMP-specific phosphodiesterase class I)
MLKTLGVDMVQGYHLDQPQAAHPALATPTV